MNYATLEHRAARLSGDFGESFARRAFGDDVVDALPRFVRGKNAGKLKGEIEWIKVTRGGWVRTARATANGDAEGYVENRVGKIIARRLIIREWGQSEGEVIAQDGDAHRFA